MTREPMTTRKTLTQLLDEHVAHCEKFISDDPDSGGMPHWLGLNAKDEATLIATPWGSWQERDAALIAVWGLFRKHRIVRYVFWSESWMRTETNPEVARNTAFGEISKDKARRVEIFMIGGVDGDERVVRNYPIIRERGKLPRLGESAGTFDKMETHFTKLLDPLPPVRMPPGILPSSLMPIKPERGGDN